MKKHIIFNIFIQFVILFMSVLLYFDSRKIVKLFISLLLIWFIFIPTFIEKNFCIKIKYGLHYLFTILCLAIFIILIAI